MDEQDNRLMRALFEIPETVSDAEIGNIESYLLECGTLGTPEMIRVANFSLLEGIREKLLPEEPKPGMYFSDDDILWLCRCERFFTDGLYGPCCLWARATLEYILQEQCLSSSRVPQDFKNMILDPEAKNPGLPECLRRLGVVAPSSVFDACILIKNHGDWVTHHRLDLLTGVDSIEALLREMNLKEEFIESLMQTGERDLMRSLRPSFERDLAIESMRSLYLVWSRIRR